MQKGFAPIFLLIGILVIVILGGAYYFSKTQISKPLSQSPVAVLSTPQPTPGKDETANWKTYTNGELSLKYPANLSHFSCTLTADNKDTEIGIDLTSQIESKIVGCGLGLKGPAIAIRVIGEDTSVEDYLQKIPTGENDKLSSIQYEKAGELTIGYVKRSNNIYNKCQIFYGIENKKNGKVYHVSINNCDQATASLITQILSTFKFLDQGNNAVVASAPKTYQEVKLIKEKYEDQLFKIANVNEVGITTCEGKYCIEVGLVKDDPASRAQISNNFEGVPVKVEVVGPVEAL